ncbi:hypothetical protein BGZ65_012743 [Modicella reniformis]|uniref:Uncharacterized protein n=1 Tax=Modicella reniformis TaxID=1440133 RepID=A0A9P6M1G2_9FUNG|nr:hypothetical protein BGZ65_012743 [Modicella reniformis]
MNDAPLQGFRAESSSKVTFIPARHDPKSKQLILRWKDIQSCFENAKRIMNGKAVVLFLTDDDLEDLHPPRIAYHPGVILHVLVAGDSQGDSSYVEFPSSAIASEASSSRRGQAPIGGQQTHQKIDNMLEQVQQTDQRVQKQIDNILERAQQTDQQTQERINDILQKIQQTSQQTHQKIDSMLEQVQQTDKRMPQQQKQIDNILERVQQTDQQTQQLQQQMEDVLHTIQKIDLQSLQQQQQVDGIMQQGHQILQQMHEMAQDNRQEIQQTHDEIRLCLKEILQLRLQESNRFMVIKSYPPALLAMSFKELRIPRLFIVLPVTAGLVDKDENLSSLQFRLYYLCECGAHTMTGDTNGHHEIHMADHPGYDLNNHHELFDKYGSYFLTMMYMVKYGAVAAGRIVPPLQNLKITNMIDMDYGRLSQLVDTAIAYLETLHIIGSTMDSPPKWMIDPSNMVQLKSYLKVKDGKSKPGNLHPTITQDRHCYDLDNHHELFNKYESYH